MTPDNRKLPEGARTSRAQQDKGRSTEAMSRINMLIAAGAVAGTLGGWGLLAQQGAASAAQDATPISTVVADISVPAIEADTSTPSAVVGSAATESTATPTATASDTVTVPTSTSIAAAEVPTTAQSTSTSTAVVVADTAIPVATSTPQATATTRATATTKPTAKPTAKATATTKVVTTTRSSK